MRKASAVVPLFFLSLCWLSGSAQGPPFNPHVARASGEGLAALKRIQIQKGLHIDLYAAEPLLANPVAFSIDEKGRIFVAETFRVHKGVTDNRNHMDWLEDDIAARTVADRVGLYRKHLKDRFKEYETEHDRIRMILDIDGDGKADKSTIFADGFHKAEQGIGAGLLARHGNVYYTCIPDLWLLKDTKGDGKADVRQSLSTGYGVHVAFFGHDMHGLRIGPDGRLYFSIGDRGLNVKTKEGKHLFHPDTGAVLRCDLDGSNLEVVAWGLRNPQELAFDDLGNLFTVDNNSDSGDRARLVCIAEGGDSGWRMSYQYGTALHDEKSRQGNRGPWNYEKLWHTQHPGQSASHLAPLAHFTDGPSGLCHYPGVGLPEKYNGQFFVCDFRGDAGTSGVWSFSVKPKGAAFELVQPERFVWSVLATDCDFGPDGGFYVSDWVHGWGMTGKGRLYKVTDPERAKTPLVADVKKLLAGGFAHRSIEELAKLLAHPHQQVRQEAQFALAAQGKDAIEALVKTAKESTNRLARIHALWGLGQVGRKEPKVFEHVLPLLADSDAEFRAQAAKVLGESTLRKCMTPLAKLTRDPEPRVRFFATQSLGRVAAAQDDTFQGLARGDLEAVLRGNKDGDPYLRHAAVVALSRLPILLRDVDLAADNPVSVRLGLLLALRRQHNPDVARFLDDADPALVTEAARAIYDEPINAASPELAAPSPQRLKQLLQPAQPPFDAAPYLFRVLNACYRLGKPEQAHTVASIAARADMPEMVRVEAVRLLGEWSKPAARDRVLGLWRPLEPRPAATAADAFRGVLGKLFAGSDVVRVEAARVAGKLGIKEVGPMLLRAVRDTGAQPGVRVESLLALERLRDQRLDEAVKLALDDAEPALRREARRLLASRDPGRALSLLTRVLDEEERVPSSFTPEEKKRATLESRQSALAVLSGLTQPEARATLGQWLDRLAGKAVAPELQLDVLEAARSLPSAAARAKLSRLEAGRPASDPLAPFRETLEGGSAKAGERLFLNRAELSCLRCHKVKGEGGEVGPDLTGIGGKQKRDYLLESLVDPSRTIAKGYETAVLTTTQGKIVTGIVKAEDAESVRLMTPEGQLVTVPKKDIEERQAGKSAMPEDLLQHLTLFELRDLVEYLASLK